MSPSFLSFAHLQSLDVVKLLSTSALLLAVKIFSEFKLTQTIIIHIKRAERQRLEMVPCVGEWRTLILESGQHEVQM